MRWGGLVLVQPMQRSPLALRAKLTHLLRLQAFNFANSKVASPWLAGTRMSPCCIRKQLLRCVAWNGMPLMAGRPSTAAAHHGRPGQWRPPEALHLQLLGVEPRRRHPAAGKLSCPAHERLNSRVASAAWQPGSLIRLGCIQPGQSGAEGAPRVAQPTRTQGPFNIALLASNRQVLRVRIKQLRSQDLQVQFRGGGGGGAAAAPAPPSKAAAAKSAPAKAQPTDALPAKAPPAKVEEDAKTAG